MLKKADLNLKERYVAPVKNIFLKYARVIGETLGEKITIYRDFNLTFERGGEIRSEKHFSSGLRSICALCMRLAFVENMYGEEKPFIRIKSYIPSPQPTAEKGSALRLNRMITKSF